MDKATLMDQTDWPKRREDATADALIVHSARTALGAQAEARRLFDVWNGIEKDAPEWTPALRDYLDALSMAIADAQIAAALVYVQKWSSTRAGELARLLWEYTEDGGVLSELMFDYLNDRGVDADAVWEVAEADARKSVDSGLGGER